MALAFGLTLLTMAFAVGLGFTLIHLISIPVTSVNPARSIGVALYVGGGAITQLWLFSIASIIGAVLGAIVYCFLGSNDA